MKSLMKGDTLAILYFVLQSKGQFGKLRSVGCKELAETHGCPEPVAPLPQVGAKVVGKQYCGRVILMGYTLAASALATCEV